MRSVPSSWLVSLVGAIVACGVAGVVLVGGCVGIQEGNAGWLQGNANATQGNVAARTAWGLTAIALSPLTLVYLVAIARRRTWFEAMHGARRWGFALGLPALFILTLVALCVIGSLVGGPIVIPYPDRP